MPNLLRLLPESLHPRLLEAFGDPFHKSSSDKPPIVPMFNMETGNLIKAVPQPGMIRVSRGRTRALCGVGIDAEFGKECVGIVFEDGVGVIAKFAGGQEIRELCAIGADGPRSIVRRSLLGAKGDAKPGGVTQYTALLRYANAETAEKVRSVDALNAIGYHPKGLVYFQAGKFCFKRLDSVHVYKYSIVQNVIDPHDPKTWTFQILVMWKPDRNQTESADVVEDNAAKLTTMRMKCSDLAEPFRSAVQEIPDGTKIWCDKIHYWLPEPWDNHHGRVTLVGDAAHPMMPCKFSSCIISPKKLPP
jgi:2-polyprenyl-6-methoxyphenol hydroxylase-like FAD-dependent oxidoreductase